MKNLDGVLVTADYDNGSSLKKHTIDQNNFLKQAYLALNCSTITIITRVISGKAFTIVADDEGLLVNDPVISARLFSSKYDEVLCGNLFICHTDNDGELKSLEPNDYKLISLALAGNCLWYDYL
jgi:hypothetical protein